MTWGAYGASWGAYEAQHPSETSIRQHQVAKNDISVICIIAGQIASGPATEWRPQQDSNLRSRLRRPLLSPLSYGGCATPKGTSRKPPASTSRRAAYQAPITVRRPFRTSVASSTRFQHVFPALHPSH